MKIIKRESFQAGRHTPNLTSYTNHSKNVLYQLWISLNLVYVTLWLFLDHTDLRSILEVTYMYLVTALDFQYYIKEGFCVFSNKYYILFKMKQFSQKLVDRRWRIEICPSHSLFLRLKHNFFKSKNRVLFCTFTAAGG